MQLPQGDLGGHNGDTQQDMVSRDSRSHQRDWSPVPPPQHGENKGSRGYSGTLLPGPTPTVYQLPIQSIEIANKMRQQSLLPYN